MPYLVLANPSQWKPINPNDFDIIGKITYKINNMNKKYVQNAQIGEKALMMITGNERKIKFIAEITNINSTEIEFSYKKRIKALHINDIKNELESINIFDKNGKLKENSIYYIDDLIYENIINFNQFCYDSRNFFKKYLDRSIKNTSNHKIENMLQLKFRNIFDNEEKLICEIGKIINKYPEKKIIFENIELEIIAYYKSYHSNYGDYGIYFNLCIFAKYILESYRNISRNYKVDFKTMRNICLEKVLQHERFHYLTELFITQNEVVSNNYNLYNDYNINYKMTYLTDNCLSEALANYFSKMYFIHTGKGKYKNILNNMFQLQAPGYRLAAKIDETNEDYYFEKYELQMFNNFNWLMNRWDLYDEFYNQKFGISKRNLSIFINYASVFLNIVKEYYLNKDYQIAQLEINNKINVPIYIVNDGIDEEDFYYLLRLIFPNFMN